MKLRIRGNSLRLRLGQGEVRQLAEEGRVEERTTFGPAAALVYALAADDVGRIDASFENGRILVRIPRATAIAWSQGDEVGLEATQSTSGAEPLRILIEKDFKCLDARPDESQDDAFPNPRGTNC